MTKVEQFVNKIAPIIQQIAAERGYLICSTTIAQAIIESRYGESGLAKYHNYFGLKCGSSWKGASVNMKTKEEYTVGTLTTIKDNFRAYPSMVEGVKGYYDFISTKRYTNLKTATSYTEFAQLLKADGYATSSSYVKTLTDTVAKYNLSRFDSVPVTAQDSVTFPTLKIGSRGYEVECVQRYLSILGYCVGNIDGIYGSRTASCVKQYQEERKLKVDGIWGPQCWASVK